MFFLVNLLPWGFRHPNHREISSRSIFIEFHESKLSTEDNLHPRLKYCINFFLIRLYSRCLKIERIDVTFSASSKLISMYLDKKMFNISLSAKIMSFKSICMSQWKPILDLLELKIIQLAWFEEVDSIQMSSNRVQSQHPKRCKACKEEEFHQDMS